MKTALITGITGQDGSYLAEALLNNGYQVYGLIRRKSELNYGSASHLRGRVKFIFGDVCDESSIINALKMSKANEVYNLAAQSFVGISWDNPKITTHINSLGVLNVLDAIRAVNPDIRFYQASTSEMFGNISQIPQNEMTPFYPRSPYGVSKLYGHWITINYRESYNMFACAGILYNHESERRGHEFVSRKITDAVSKIKLGLLDVLEIGNLYSKRDWGHAMDYVQAMYLMLQQDLPGDYVISSGKTNTVKKFIEAAFNCIDIDIIWEGTGLNEKGLCRKTGRTLVLVNPNFFRKSEVDILLGDSSKAKSELGWESRISFESLVERMVLNDLRINAS